MYFLRLRLKCFIGIIFFVASYAAGLYFLNPVMKKLDGFP